MLGALLLSTIGGALWVLLFYFNIFHEICGVACVVGAVIGYRLFAKSASLKGVILSIVISIFMLLVASYFSLTLDVYYAYQNWYANGEVAHAIEYYQALSGAYQFLSEPLIALACLKEFGIGILFVLLGSFVFIIDGVRHHKMMKEY